MPDAPATFDIYERLWREATTAPPRGPRPCAADGPEVRAIASPADSLARLIEHFSPEELAAAGVAELDAEGRLAPAPALRGDGVEIIALRERADAEPYGLLTHHGCLRGETVLAMLGDYRWRRRADESSGYVYLAFSWDDWLWLDAAARTALYCPAADQLTIPLVHSLAAELAAIAPLPPARDSTPAADPGPPRGGVDAADPPPRAAVDAAATAQNRETCGGERDGDAPPADASREGALRSDTSGNPRFPEAADPPGASRFALVIVGWSPATGETEEPPGLAPQLAELAQWEQLVHDAYRGMEVILWRPGAEEVHRMELVGRHGNCETLAHALDASVESYGQTLSSLLAPPPAHDFLEARAAYRRALLEFARGSAEQSELQAIQSQYEHHFQEQIIKPLLSWGAESLDPRERARCAAMAETYDLFHRVTPVVAAELSELASRGGSLADSLAPGSGLQASITLIKALAASAGRKH